MDGSKAIRRRQLVDLYQAGNEDALLRRRRPRTRSKPAKSRVCSEWETVRQEKEKAVYGSIAETLEYGQKRAWHYGYQNQPSLSNSGPLAAASRYGAKGTLRMIRREASALRGGRALNEGSFVEGLDVDEWSPMLRCSTSPSLATMTTPKAWPESAMYPHGSHPKRMQPSPWYDGETTANDVRASTATLGMQRVAANHSYTMSILQRNASLEHAAAELAPQSKPPANSSVRPSTAGSGRGARGKKANTRTPKRLNQEMGFSSGGIVYFTASKDPLTHGLQAALEERLVRQADLDGVKWSLLKQVLKVITGSQFGLPLQAVKEVASNFGAVVGTSKLATKAQFTDHITGKHVGFPESELATLFGFFRSAIGVAANARNAVSNRKGNPQGPCTQGGRVSSRASQRQHSAVGGGCSGNDGNVAYGADWTVAVACLRLLAKPKEAVLSSILGVFEVFARARGNRISHQRRLEQEKLERERQKELEEERERWKRRRRREQERGTTPTESLVASNPQTLTVAASPNRPRDSNCNGGDQDRVSLGETVRMFTLVCSNDQERHAVTTTYRHRFRLELKAVMQERRNPYRFRHRGNRGGETGGGGGRGRHCVSPSGAVVQTAPDSLSPRPVCSSKNLGRPNVHSSGARTLSPGWPAADKENTSATTLEAFPTESEGPTKGGWTGEGGGVTAEEFSEALVRCPEMLQVFGTQLAARLRHRHRPPWMAPILRKGR